MRFAVLVKRDAAVPWIGRFQTRTYGGFWENLVTTGRRWLGLDLRTTILQISDEDGFVDKDSLEGAAIAALVDENCLVKFSDTTE